jgi:hypothetical protein
MGKISNFVEMKAMKEIVLELHYLPSIHYLKTIKKAQKLHVEAYENYQKGSYRNRCLLPSSNGLLTLSIPLQKGKNQHTPIQSVLMANELPWKREQWKTIQSIYRSAPFFEVYEMELASLLMNDTPYLFEYNWKLLTWLLKQLNVSTTVVKTEEFQVVPDLNLTDLRNQFIPKKELPAGEFVHYFQLFEDRIGFQSNMSALDLLFMCGPESGVHL